MIILRILVILICILFTALVCGQIVKGRLLLRYSLLWLTLALVAIFVSIFPDPIYALASVFGFDTPSNFIFFVALFFVMAICLSLSVAVSKQTLYVKDLVQNLALIEEKIEHDCIIKQSINNEDSPTKLNSEDGDASE